VGTSTITWTATDNWNNSVSCQTTVVVNESPAVTIPDVFVLPEGVDANTVYTGYAPAAVLTLTANASGGVGPYTYSWSLGTGLAIASGAANQPSVNITGTMSGDYSSVVTLTVTDAKGCSVSTSFTVSVVDVRSGNKNDKVTVCHKGNELSVSSSAVPAHLSHGDKLGSCSGTARMGIVASPNPSSSYFNIQINNTSKHLDIKVMDMMGRTVQQIKNASADQLIRIGDNYEPGMYFIEVTTDKEKITLKIVKLKK
jgi:hypothetical protein